MLVLLEVIKRGEVNLQVILVELTLCATEACLLIELSRPPGHMTVLRLAGIMALAGPATPTAAALTYLR